MCVMCVLGQAQKCHNENWKIRGQHSVVDSSFYQGFLGPHSGHQACISNTFPTANLTSTTPLNSNPQMVSLLYSNASLFLVGFLAEDLFVALAGFKLTFWVRVVLNFLHLPPNYEHGKYVLSCSVNLMY